GGRHRGRPGGADRPRPGRTGGAGRPAPAAAALSSQSDGCILAEFSIGWFSITPRSARRSTNLSGTEDRTMAPHQGFTNAVTLGQEVRVTIPASLFHNLEAMQRVTKQVLGQLGCEGCHSGFDIRYDVVRQFVVDERGAVQSPFGPGTPNAPSPGKTAK